jgi:hypothetical protein
MVARLEWSSDLEETPKIIIIIIKSEASLGSEPSQVKQ